MEGMELAEGEPVQEEGKQLVGEAVREHRGVVVAINLQISINAWLFKYYCFISTFCAISLYESLLEKRIRVYTENLIYIIPFFYLII